MSGDARLLAEALRSGRRPDGRRGLPGAAVLAGDLHPDDTGAAPRCLGSVSESSVLTFDPYVPAVGPVHDGHLLAGPLLQRSGCSRLLPLLQLRGCS